MNDFDRMVYEGDYGATLNARIDRDAQILADLVKQGTVDIEFLRNGSGETGWKAFKAAGGDDGHSGNSFAHVRLKALQLLGDDGEWHNPALLILKEE